MNARMLIVIKLG